MRKRLKQYLTELAALSFDQLPEKERQDRMTDLLTQISFFQHERLVHLIVTALFALLTFLGLLLFSLQPSVLSLCLEGLFLVLLIPYIIHYYFLENGVQKLYEYYDRLQDNGLLYGDKK